MKADISTLHKPDILTLQRHWWQIPCVQGRRSVRCASQRAKSEIPAKEKNMEKHDVTHLETQTNELIANLVKLADDNDLKQFLKTIHHPGFTTPAELFLFRGVVDS